jgi:acetyl/propionyl-CoA carboxylase alpha subunit
MGIETVAVYSEFDRNAPHVSSADQAVPIGPAAPRDSYLNIPSILRAAQLCKADAIHPGYGFLAENADFAAACENAGIAFIGPKSSVIRAMGSKIEARRLAQEAGVPVVPSASKNDISRLGFPILIKASAGGGGRGMRIVRQASEFQEAVDAAHSEAERAFGDGALLFEKYIEGARHVEIQIFGDHHGNLMHLNERDCSIQRRHQKIIEESPSPAVTPDLRERMGEAALKLAKKIGYTNAGTVEFLLAPQQARNQTGAPAHVPSAEFYFIEVNTRIQVEHPVTEMVTGLDLIRLQIEIAQNGSVPTQRPLPAGHAIEARLYAEDPLNNFLPSTGTLHLWQSPVGMDDLRVDSGVESGMEIGVHYDPLLAKIIAHAPDRESAINRLVYALRHFVALGVETNREFLIDVLEHDEFRAGRAHTGFQLETRRHTKYDDVFVAVARSFMLHREQSERKVLPSVPIRYRNNPWHAAQSGSALVPACEILKVNDGNVSALVEGVRYEFQVCTAGECATRTFYIYSSLGQKAVVLPERYPRPAGAGERQSANSPMPGQVLRILVSEGQRVKTGDALIALEAMKMEQTIKATMDGIVERLLVSQGEIVAPGQKLVEIQAERTNSNTKGKTIDRKGREGR